MELNYKGILPKNFTLSEKYHILFFIKDGSNAQTYRAKGNDGKLYLLKLFNYSKIHRTAFDKDNNLLEIELIKKIKHANIISYQDSGELIFEGKKFGYLVLDFIAGETLAERITREPISNVYDIKQIVIGILNGLNYLHSLPEPIIHNEITPQNIMLDLSGDMPQPKIIDFGYARSFLQSSKSFNRAGLNLNYVASECFNNLYSPQSDLFSVGALMYHLLFGLPPWFKDISNFKIGRGKMEEVILDARARPLTFPKIEDQIIGYNESIINIINKSLHHDPNSRFQSANEFIQALNSNNEFDEIKKLKESSQVDLNKSINSNKTRGFKAIAGMKTLKDQLQNDVINVIENPEEYKKHNLSLPNGILLYGPPGCGKTFFAEKFAEEAGFNFIKVISSDLASIYIHGTQEKIAALFKKAREQAPTILFFDELDAMITSREEIENQSQSGEVNEFLSQLDNIGNSGVFVIGSTNKPDNIDSAVLRAGRIEKWIYIPPPDKEARESLFEMYLKDRPLDFDIDYEKLANITENYVSSDIKLLVDEASRKTIKDKSKRISMAILEFTIKHQKPTVKLSELREFEEIRRKIEGNIDDEKDKRKIGF